MAEGFIDFDPTTDEGQENINSDIQQNIDEYEHLIDDDLTGKSLWNKFKKFGKNGVKYAWDYFKGKTKYGAKMPEYMELENMDEVKEKAINKYIEDANNDSIRELEDRLEAASLTKR